MMLFLWLFYTHPKPTRLTLTSHVSVSSTQAGPLNPAQGDLDLKDFIGP